MAKKKGESTSTTLEAHSRAKVELFKEYLAIYLNIMQRAVGIDHLMFFDICAGEGVYADGGKGSPVMIMETIKDHYFANEKQCLRIHVELNDPGLSKVEKGRKKIERVEEAVTKLFRPSNVQVSFSARGYTDILGDVQRKVDALGPKERAIVFIDPWGYKEIKPLDLVQLMKNGRTEVLLFLPTSDMHRFARKALSDDEFPGGVPLREFLLTLYAGDSPDTSTALEFAGSLLQRFKLLPDIKYVDKFTLERGTGRYFCLYFFTSHRLGLRKMVEAKWRIDEKEGRGFVLPKVQVDLFTGHQHSGYPEVLKEGLKKSGGMTNEQLELFGLVEGYLPKHTADLFKLWKEEGILEVVSLDGLPVKGYYLNDMKRQVMIKLKHHG